MFTGTQNKRVHQAEASGEYFEVFVRAIRNIRIRPWGEVSLLLLWEKRGCWDLFCGVVSTS